MFYLLQSLFIFILAAFVLGLVVGWMSCKHEPRKEGMGWMWFGLAAFVFGLFISASKWIKGSTGLWFDTAMWLFGAYLLGCLIGCMLSQWLRPAPETAVTRSATEKMTMLQGAAPVAAAATAAAVMAATKTAAGPAAVRPYQWQAAKDASAVTLTGYVPSDDARGRIIADAKATLAPSAIIDKLQLGSGAPVGMESMTRAALGHLGKLDKGIASLIDTKYTLTGIAGTQPNYDGVISGVRALPTGYSLAKVDIVAPPLPKPAPAPAPKAPAPKAAEPAALAAISAPPAPKPAPAPKAAEPAAPAAISAPPAPKPAPAPKAAEPAALAATSAKPEPKPAPAPKAAEPAAPAAISAPPAPKPAPAPKAAEPAALAATSAKPEPKPAPKLPGEDKVPGKRPPGYAKPIDGKADDLKRIRGIGKQNEGRLHGLGIWHFSQIEKWIPDECLWVGSYLAFPGRIEREEWVKQAKVLAAGKQTEFSKRVAKGKVATSMDDGTLGKTNVEVTKPLRAVKGTAPKGTKKT